MYTHVYVSMYLPYTQTDNHVSRDARAARLRRSQRHMSIQAADQQLAESALAVCLSVCLSVRLSISTRASDIEWLVGQPRTTASNRIARSYIVHASPPSRPQSGARAPIHPSICGRAEYIPHGRMGPAEARLFHTAAASARPGERRPIHTYISSTCVRTQAAPHRRSMPSNTVHILSCLHTQPNKSG